MSVGNSSGVATNSIDDPSYNTLDPDYNAIVPEYLADETADEASIGLDSKLVNCITGFMRSMSLGKRQRFDAHAVFIIILKKNVPVRRGPFKIFE